MKTTRREQFPLPPLPQHPYRRVVEQALGGAFRTVRFTVSEESMVLPDFFRLVMPLLLETVDLLAGEPFDLKVCARLVLQMDHLVQENETIYLSMKARPLTRSFVQQMETHFAELFESFRQRGSGFTLHRIQCLEYEIVQYYSVPQLTGH